MIRRPLSAVFAAALLLPALAAAQSSYTMTVLKAPSSALTSTGIPLYTPTGLSNQGVVYGGMSYKTGTKLGIPTSSGGCLICSYYGLRPVSWAAGTTASVTPTLGALGVFPFFSNDQGTLVGPARATSTQTNLLQYADGHAGALNPYSATSYSTVTALRKGSTDTVQPSAISTVMGVNNLDWVLATGVNRGAPAGTPYASYQGLVVRHGVVTVLDSGNYASAEPRAINNAGVILGSVSQPDATAPDQLVSRLALWVNDKLTTVADLAPGLMFPLAINSSGQALVITQEPGAASTLKLWFNGNFTTVISAATSDEFVSHAALNDSGTVVACLTTAATRATIWRNGVATDLATELTAKGVKLPTGTRWACPLAINNSGAILTHYVDNSSPPKVTWVRLNAKP
jgi:hypothetical protein